MSEAKEEPASSQTSEFEQIGASFKDAQTKLDESIRVGARELGKGVAVLGKEISHNYGIALSTFDEVKEYVHQARAQAQHIEDAAVSAAKSGLTWGLANPIAAYPLTGSAVLLAFPGMRRLLWRKTLGRFSNPETALKNSADRVENIKGHLGEHSLQLSKLQERMLAAEAEYNNGYKKLKSTRIELQRLASSVQKDEKTANAVVRDLRALKSQSASLSLRAEAASHLAQLRTQRLTLNKHINRISNKDI